MAIIPHCGCGNPGSIPGGDTINFSIIILLLALLQHNNIICFLERAQGGSIDFD